MQLYYSSQKHNKQEHKQPYELSYRKIFCKIITFQSLKNYIKLIFKE